MFHSFRPDPEGPDLVNHAVVFAMGTYPEPDDSIRYGYSESAVMNTDTNRPKLADLFKMERRVARILFQQGKIGIGTLLDCQWKTGVATTISRRSVMNQRGLHWPVP